jgi:ATP-dependent Clp protease ATP-binding subunit ClpA
MTPNEEEITSGGGLRTMTVLKIVFNNPANKSNKTKTPVLDNFGRDLTEMAEEGKLDCC